MRLDHRLRDTQPVMAEHLARSARQRRVAILGIALAAGGIAFTYADGDDTPGVSPTGSPGSSDATGATVLGVVITQPDALPTAAPASPASVDDAEDPSPPSTVGTSVTSRPPASLVPPTVIENTTSTTDGGPPPTVDLSTTTSTEPSSTTTTEVPPG